ncbi:MAG: pyruvate flavodoxin/ferredoxin oxidoreductase domain protein [Proteobacteria bacterium]|nr:pyruvate flavodoxin/ferredoxin oxidoreductase domain protein [Pseudomonadota bacterium]
MDADLQAHIAFYLTGKRHSPNLLAIDGLKLQPALFAGYRDLTRLRYDFPLVLVKEGPAAVEPLSGLIDAILDKVARGDDGERIRKHVLRLEQEIRTRVAKGTSGTFSTLWDAAAPALAKDNKLMAESLSRARANLKVDGDVIDCDASLPYHLLGHAWAITQTQRAKKFAKDINRLVQKLSDIIKADFVNSDAGKSAENLRASFGNGPMDSFDFAAMSRILVKASAKKKPAKSRQKRVQNLLAVLQSQRFFPTSSATAEAPYSFAFDSCNDALKAYRERLPKAIELARAIAMAELEVRGEYSEVKHDALFESFGQNGLDEAELALLPDYLVRINATSLSGAEQSKLNEILAIDLPIKVVVQTDDVIEESPVGHLAFALRSRQLASMAMGINDVFVLQSPAASLYQLREQIQRGLDYTGPALFSVFSGATKTSGGLPPYLIGAAALESRVFPAFTFDPSAGRDWASRFCLATNPQAEEDWPLREFAYEDEKNQAVAQQLPFTLIDFVACDTRYSKHFSLIPRTHWNDTLVPVETALAQPGRGSLDSVPCLTMVDGEDRLQKVIVDEKLIREARRCRSMWNSLQELGGIHNSHAEKLLASERLRWEEKLAAASASAAKPAAEPVASVAAPVAAAEAAPVEPEAERSPDEAYIETARCSTCNECVQFNNKMFAYDGNQQAYIADVNAGTYAQLVEAAENCQVSIIHPGKPRNPNEPGLEELIKRAELFA